MKIDRIHAELAKSGYARGEAIRVTVTFSEAVAVTGAPGFAKWRLRVTADQPIRVMSLLASGPTSPMCPLRPSVRTRAHERTCARAHLALHQFDAPRIEMTPLIDHWSFGARLARLGCVAAGLLGLALALGAVPASAQEDTTPPTLVRGEADGGTITAFSARRWTRARWGTTSG